MNTLNLNKNKFKSISSNLLNSIKHHEGEITHSQMLQFLAQSIYNKPYEEVKNVYFEDEKKETYFLRSNNHYFAFVEKKLVFRGKQDSLDENIVVNLIKKEKGMSDLSIDKISWIDIPFTVLGLSLDEYADEKGLSGDDINIIVPNPNEIYKTAKLLGYINKNLMSAMNDADGAIINGIQVPYLVDGDYFDKIEEYGVNGTIWHAESVVNHSFYEFFFSLKEIGSATFDQESNEWTLIQNEDGVEKHYHIKLY